MDATGWGDEYSDEYSEIGDKGEIGFIDFENDKSVCSYNPDEESDVIVSAPFPFIEQKPQSVSVDEVAADSITIRNTTDDSVQLWGVHIYASNPEDLFTLSLMEPSAKGFVGSSDLDDRMLQPHKTLTIWLSCTPKDIGLQTCIVHVDVEDERLERVVFLLAEDNISKSLASNKPYQRERRKTPNFTVDSYVSGVRPSRPPIRGFRHRLSSYEIPRDIREVIESKQVPDSILGGLTRKNYVSFFRTLLIMEELRLEEDIRAYDMENVTMKSRGRQFLTLEVLGLAERRPSLVHGDSVFARLSTVRADEATVYEGCIHRVEADQVYLKFSDDFHQRHRDGHSYNIRFMYNRVNMRRLYHAIESAEKLPKDILFPSLSVANRQIKPKIVVPISRNLNEEQLNAVEMILGCKGGVPYMINGPPGTGKTMTLVEAILQIYKTRKGSQILVCASSNCAADHILEKILKIIELKVIDVRENEVFRLNATSRSFDDMKEEYRRFCFYEDSVFRCPPLNALLRYRIVITTYMSSSMLYAEGIKCGHFSHIILDEAGQASEPESIVPVSNLCRDDTVIVLAGDPAQLGPVIFSPDAKNHGLGKSYLERLFECELYIEGDEGYVTTLLRNYRCHPEILELPSKLFYRGELIACHEPVKSSPWEDLLLNKEFPVLFKGVQAYDEREGNNPSWFNRTEASMVVKLIKKLTARDISEEDIGVITPYRQQVTKIKKALEDDEICDVKIGSVEQFQGQEREVIIISTVRSTIKHEDFDRVHCLGFLSNPKRFNVALTRAKSLLVIIGNPHIICKDPYWAKLLWRCVENNSYEGCSLPEKQCFDDEGDTPTEGWPHSEEKAHDGEANSWGDTDRQANSWSDANGQVNSWEDPEIKDGKANSWEDDDGKANSWGDAEEDDGQANSWGEEDDGQTNSWGNFEEKHNPEVSCQDNGQANSSDDVEEKHDPVVSSRDEYLAQPCKEEDEWSDGWK